MPPQLNKPSLDPEFMPPQLNKTSLDPENSKMMHRIKQYLDQYGDILGIELDSKLCYRFAVLSLQFCSVESTVLQWLF
jgi:hypothetical protein